MSRLKSWSFWLMVVLDAIATWFATGWFLDEPVITGVLWTTFTGGLYTTWSVKDGYLKGKNGAQQ